MPSQDRVWSDDGGELLKHLPQEDLALTASLRRSSSLSEIRFCQAYGEAFGSLREGTR